MGNEKLIVNIRFAYDTYPSEIDLKKLPSQLAYNYILNCRSVPISCLEFTVKITETEETGIYIPNVCS